MNGENLKSLSFEDKLTPVDKAILNSLKNANKPLSTYKLSKISELSWSTVNTHCYKLKSMGLVDSKVQRSKFGGKKLFWFPSISNL